MEKLIRVAHNGEFEQYITYEQFLKSFVIERWSGERRTQKKATIWGYHHTVTTVTGPSGQKSRREFTFPKSQEENELFNIYRERDNVLYNVRVDLVKYLREDVHLTATIVLVLLHAHHQNIPTHISDNVERYIATKLINSGLEGRTLEELKIITHYTEIVDTIYIQKELLPVIQNHINGSDIVSLFSNSIVRSLI